MNNEFNELILKAQQIQKSKEHDYSASGPDENFERQAIIISWFKNPIDQAFAAMIGIKLARLATLLNGKSPKNESVEDTFLDFFNYSGLWGANYIRRIIGIANQSNNLFFNQEKLNSYKVNHEWNKHSINIPKYQITETESLDKILTPHGKVMQELELIIASSNEDEIKRILAKAREIELQRK